MDKVRYYKLAVASSLVSKLGTTLLHLALTPLAAVALGADGFALYVMLLAASGWLAIANLGLGPVLLVQVAHNCVDGTPRREQIIVASGFWLSLGLSLVAAILTAAIIFLLPTQEIFGPQFELRSSEVIIGLLLLTAVYVLQANVSVFEAVQTGLQRQHTTNLVVAVGALITVPAVFTVAHWVPTPVAMLMAGLLPMLALRLGHVVWLVSKRPTMLPRWHSFDAGVAKVLLSSGAIYSLAGSAGNFLSHALPTIQVGRVMDAIQTGAFASTLHLVTLLSGVTTMFVSPAVPAIASSMAQYDHAWVLKAYKKVLLASLGFAVVAALAIAILGEEIFEAWLRGAVHPEWGLLVGAGVYFVLLTWEVVHFSLLVAMKKAALGSILVFTRAVVGAIFTQVNLTNGDGATPYVAMCFAILLVDSVPLYLLVASGLRSGR